MLIARGKGIIGDSFGGGGGLGGGTWTVGPVLNYILTGFFFEAIDIYQYQNMIFT